MSQSPSALKPARPALRTEAALGRTLVSGADRNSVGLDWFAFFCANLQTGFGPFVAAYLTASKWTQTDIGLVLMVGGLVGLFGQIPGGALVDRTQRKTVIAAVAVAAIGCAALFVALSSIFLVILAAWVLHALASCVLSPAINTVSLRLVGHELLGQRLGRNATFASVGSALAAAGMGVCGDYLSNRAVFFVTAALAVPALLSLLVIDPSMAPVRDEPRPQPASEPAGPHWVMLAVTGFWRGLRVFAADRALVMLAASVALFFLANAAMLPLVGSMLTLRSARSPTMLIAACIIVPQILVAFLSPAIGAAAQRWGRRPLLIAGFAALPIKGLCLALVTAPQLLVAAQFLDGISAAAVGVLVPLIAADVTRGTGRFALAQGTLGTAMGVGASFSSTIAGVLADHYGSRTAFSGLALIAVAALVIVVFGMPETRQRSQTAAATPKA